MPCSPPPGRDSRTATLIAGFFWWMVPAQVPLTRCGMGRTVVATGPLAAASGVGAGVPVVGCRPVMKTMAATIASTQPAHAAAQATARERP
ncbi:MAG: hypothetical protein J2P30_10460, partial [Actinobacteria bacterium]|nr:hypothetical protein [Actinomycetota bacterium]